mmetsp:Transcript_34507/g.75316  ORF Transcript_34507/g.75316 Transcript_34507/m.75316 type:complete len:180 (+) Transcript_34507:455-994(+)|eukprot:CAMPEP_0170582762 /NCGR_PEP_ID=MMETSP0224-20130122/7760_1 /TAXON_ID=285029 /ORGANISM="Togula jolla, Strain CCCM 725" /LENGTH=179 /DNA_ID=CAMNT_0010906015 /DNA_START=449 /DNA_END=988 /DNA_ORIENTATION=-
MTWGYTSVCLEFATWQDISRAVKWLRIKGKRYRVDPTFIALYGYSNGGNLGAKAALSGKGKSKVQAAIIVAGSKSLHIPFIHWKAPPFLLVHSHNDLAVNFRGAMVLAAELEKFRVPMRTLFYRKGGHTPQKLCPRQFKFVLSKFLDQSVHGQITFMPGLIDPPTFVDPLGGLQARGIF